MLSLKHVWLKRSALTLLVALNLIALSGYYRFFQKEAWDEAAAFAVEQIKSDPIELIFFDRGYVRTGFNYYFRRYEIEVPEVPLDDPEQIEAQINRHAGSGRVLLVFSHTGGDTRSGDTLERRGELVDGMRFFGGAVILYNLR